jgi:hypothetical protein
VTTAQDGMNQATSLAVSGGYNWNLVYQAWNVNEIDW